MSLHLVHIRPYELMDHVPTRTYTRPETNPARFVFRCGRAAHRVTALRACTRERHFLWGLCPATLKSRFSGKSPRQYSEKLSSRLRSARGGPNLRPTGRRKSMDTTGHGPIFLAPGSKRKSNPGKILPAFRSTDEPNSATSWPPPTGRPRASLLGGMRVCLLWSRPSSGRVPDHRSPLSSGRRRRYLGEALLGLCPHCRRGHPEDRGDRIAGTRPEPGQSLIRRRGVARSSGAARRLGPRSGLIFLFPEAQDAGQFFRGSIFS